MCLPISILEGSLQVPRRQWLQPATATATAAAAARRDGRWTVPIPATTPTKSLFPRDVTVHHWATYLTHFQDDTNASGGTRQRGVLRRECIPRPWDDRCVSLTCRPPRLAPSNTPCASMRSTALPAVLLSCVVCALARPSVWVRNQPTPWSQRAGAGAVVVPDHGFVAAIVGGQSTNDALNSTFLNDVWLLPAGSSFDGFQLMTPPPSSPMWQPRTCLGLAYFHSALWVTGGYDATAAYGDAWSSQNGSDWTQHAVPWAPRYGHVSFVLAVRRSYLRCDCETGLLESMTMCVRVFMCP